MDSITYNNTCNQAKLAENTINHWEILLSQSEITEAGAVSNFLVKSPISRYRIHRQTMQAMKC